MGQWICPIVPNSVNIVVVKYDDKIVKRFLPERFEKKIRQVVALDWF